MLAHAGPCGIGCLSTHLAGGYCTYYYSDGLGLTTTVIDGSGAVVSEYDYDVSGSLAPAPPRRGPGMPW